MDTPIFHKLANEWNDVADAAVRVLALPELEPAEIEFFTKAAYEVRALLLNLERICERGALERLEAKIMGMKI